MFETEEEDKGERLQTTEASEEKSFKELVSSASALKAVKIADAVNWKKVKEELFGDTLQQGLLKVPDLKTFMMNQEEDDEVKVEIVSESYFVGNELKRAQGKSCSHRPHSSNAEDRGRKACECDLFRSKMSVLQKSIKGIPLEQPKVTFLEFPTKSILKTWNLSIKSKIDKINKQEFILKTRSEPLNKAPKSSPIPIVTAFCPFEKFSQLNSN